MTVLLASAIGVGVLSAATPTDPRPRTSASATATDRRDQTTRPCPGARRGLAYYRASYSRSRTRMGLPPAPRYVRYDCEATRRRATEWRIRAATERAELAEWERTVGKVVDRLDRGLAGTPLAGLGATFESAGRRYGISPYFMAAAAGTESSFGAAPCSRNPKNVWGLAACDGRWHVPYFETWAEAIEFYARFLASRWPSATTPYEFYGYAACDACWGRKTSSHMGRFGVGNGTRYP